MNIVLTQDVDDVVARLGDEWKKFSDKTILITGVTGLIGSLLTRVYLKLNEQFNANIRIILVARSEQKIQDLFGKNLGEKVSVCLQFDTTDHLEIQERVDFIVHTAAPASSRFFVEEPVETMDAIINGSKRILELAKEKASTKVVLLSSMEAYGLCEKTGIKEGEQGYIDYDNVRSSYAIGKRAAEFLSYAYHEEYGVPGVSVRLAMCFGAGQKANDPRVHTLFCNAAIRGIDLEMRSTGKTSLNFVYAADAVLAILLLLVRGKGGEAYNVASDALGYNIMDMAQYIAGKCGVGVKQNIDNDDKKVAADNAMTLNTDKIVGLGWKPKYNIEDALDRYMLFLRNEQQGKLK